MGEKNGMVVINPTNRYYAQGYAMRMLDLFSGIGGFSLAATWCWGRDLNIVAFCDNDPFCQSVLRKHWPDVPIFEDIRSIHGKAFKEVDLLTGGFPCQPFSEAGKRRGKADNRYLWPEMFRVIHETKPRWVIGENVTGIISMGLETAITDLESICYEVQPFTIPACGINAKHKRDRVWFVAYSDNSGNRASQYGVDEIGEKDDEGWKRQSFNMPCGCGKDKSYHTSNWELEPNVGRVAHGVPDRVDRIRALGNAIVPQVAYQIMCAIKVVDGD